MKSIFLRRKHRHHLTPTGQDGFQGLCPLIGQGPHRGLDCLAKPYQNLGVQTVRLGQLASSLGEISHLAGINNHHRQLGSRQSTSHRKLQPSSGFKDHQGGLQLAGERPIPRFLPLD